MRQETRDRIERAEAALSSAKAEYVTAIQQSYNEWQSDVVSKLAQRRMEPVDLEEGVETHSDLIDEDGIAPDFFDPFRN